MAPIGQFVRLTKTYGPQSLNRFNLYTSIAVNGAAADGYSSGDAIRAIGETAATALPKGYSYEFGGITREESTSTSNTVMIFAICFVLVYLILSALYESFFIPLAVVLSLPFGLFGSFLFAQLMGLENNIYMQTGIIMLIGLLQGGHVANASCGRSRQSTSAPDSDDRTNNDFRSATTDGINRSRSQR